MTPYGRSLSHNLWFEKNCPICLCSLVLELPHWCWDTSHEYPCYQDIDRTIFICFILSRLHQCKIYVMGLLYPFSGCVILYYNSFFRSWHRCTDNLKGKVLINKISHSGCTILYQVSNKSTLQNSEVLAPQYWQSERNARNIFKKSGDSMPQKDHKTTLFNDKTLDDDFVLIQIYISEARIVGPERGLFRCISCTDHRPWLTDRNWRLALPHV